MIFPAISLAAEYKIYEQLLMCFVFVMFNSSCSP